jgi:hypothetical protein
MDTQSLPIVTFGKYKDKSVLELLADKQTLEWYKKQPWFQEKYPVIYNIVVNQQITSNNQNSKTPEHNKLQNLFLDPDNLLKLRKSLYKNYIDNFEIKLNNLINDEEFIALFGEHKKEDLINFTDPGKVIFEDKYNWDMCYYMNTQFISFDEDGKEKIKYKEQYDIKKEEYMAKIQEEQKWRKESCRGGITDEKFKKICEEKYQEKFNEHYKKYRDGNSYYKGFVEKYLSGYTHRVCGYREYDIELELLPNYLICCEIKPTLGDDYPEVLRKMKTQQTLSDNDKKWAKSDFIHYHKIYLLIIGSFESKAASRKQLIEIFKQSNIIVKFINDIIPQSNIGYLPAKQQVLADQQLLQEGKEDEEIIECEEYEYEGKTYGLTSDGDLYTQEGELVGKVVNGKVIFKCAAVIAPMNELNIQQKLLKSEQEIKQLKEQTKKLEEENKKQQEEIKQLKEQNKKLEEELTLLKTPKTTKTITDYFGKKK